MFILTENHTYINSKKIVKIFIANQYSFEDNENYWDIFIELENMSCIIWFSGFKTEEEAFNWMVLEVDKLEYGKRSVCW